tara:strand:- start:1764 stop:2069 length:306 start_codon:yes stop_codon:yes gene_type:complete
MTYNPDEPFATPADEIRALKLALEGANADRAQATSRFTTARVEIERLEAAQATIREYLLTDLGLEQAIQEQIQENTFSKDELREEIDEALSNCHIDVEIRT